MISFRYAALAALVAAAAPAMAQQQSVADYSPTAVAFDGTDASSLVLTDSIFYDTGDNNVQFGVGFGFPGGSATPGDPGENRAIRYTTAVRFTVPATRTTPFTLTGARVLYRTSTVSGATSTPPRVQYDADVEPIIDVFRGGDLVSPDDDSTLAQGQVASNILPFTTATITSGVDGYMVPIAQFKSVSFIPTGATTAPANLIFQPGEQFSIRVQYFNIPFPASTEAGSDITANGDSTSASVQVGFDYNANFDLLTFNGFGVADTGGADMILDKFVIRALSDDAFTAGEQQAVDGSLTLGAPMPNPARGVVELPFALRDGGAARITVYDALGREVSVVADRAFASGGQVQSFDTSRLAPGVYVVVLEANGVRATQRLSVVR